jgi:hypothetical protein
MAATVVSGGGDGAMRASVVAVMVMAVVRAVVRMTVAGPAVTAASSSNDSGGNVVRGTSHDARGVVVGYKGVVSRIRCGGIAKMGWLGKRVRATAHGRGGRDVVRRHGWGERMRSRLN